MEKLKHKSTEANAVQWMGTAESEKEIRALGTLTEWREENDCLFVSTTSGVAVARPGDFVVNDAGKFGVFSPEEFKVHYEGAK